MREARHPAGVLAPRGPYSPAVVAAGPLLFVSSQGPLDPVTGAVVPGGISAEARQALTNVRAIVEGCGGSLADAVKVTVFLRDLADFAAMNEVYAEFFPEPRPARTTVQSNLAFSLAIDAIVAVDGDRTVR
ncbi:MAG TPA: Rid family hydrolase [Candidatus Saccharimonadales bacterium]|nr:Rid family hydrolase [Candidatus Saccharimonadales bacterium]